MNDTINVKVSVTKLALPEDALQEVVACQCQRTLPACNLAAIGANLFSLPSPLRCLARVIWLVLQVNIAVLALNVTWSCLVARVPLAHVGTWLDVS